MADTFFGFDADIPGEDDLGLSAEAELEEDFDRLNDDTFGSGAIDDGDWETNHKKLAELEELRKRDGGSQAIPFSQDALGQVRGQGLAEDMERSINQLMLEDEFDDPAIMSIRKGPLSPDRYNTASPPALLQAETLISPGRQSIWSSPSRSALMGNKVTILQRPSEPAEPRTLPMEVGISSAFQDSAIVSAVPRKSSPPLVPSSARTLEEIERDLRGSGNRAAPSPPLGRAISPGGVSFASPQGNHHPRGGLGMHPIGTPPRTNHMPPGMPMQGPGGMPLQRPLQSPHSLPPGPHPPPPGPHPPPGFHNARPGMSTPPPQHPLPRGHPTPPMRPPFPRTPLRPGMVGPMGFSPHMMRGGERMSPHMMRGGDRVSSPGPGPGPGLMPFMPRSPFQHGRMPPPPHQGPPGGSPMNDTALLHPYHRQILQQREQQFRQRQRGGHHPGGRGMPGPGPHGNRNWRDGPGGFHGGEPRDEYAGLMTQREKEWVVKIQMLQLQSSNPMMEDYYYQAYMSKKMAQEAERPPSQGTSGEGDGPGSSPPKLITPQLKQEHKTYKPAHFEHTLGRVSVSSVNNPRKLIDFAAHAEEDHDMKSGIGKDHRRRELLLLIEKTYSVMLELEDIEKKVMSVSEEERRSLLEARIGMVHQIYNNFGLTADGSNDDQFLHWMCIRKGKSLVGRVLPILPRDNAATVVTCVLRNLAILIRKDTQDEMLPHLSSSVSHVIRNSHLDHLTSFLQAIIQGNDGANLTAAVQNKFGMSVLCSLLTRAETLFNTDVDTPLEEEALWGDLVGQVCKELLSVPEANLASPVKPPTGITNHVSRFVDKQTSTALEQRLRSLHGV
ncbi:protein PAT1 homolog 1-like isoform X2 [Branchiostoma floridae]|uniref:Protein PAT1 homolog 1-like isoform X1 n=1 Tax=Branchiostoma floridae TaxID=7739 RepID=A0A9J7HQI3_BRAFL|nr:protein PAT1 homolog 1-like isoform X1 [Branchiostoma floridae]XP_035662600.1 protein PAT1 homolog 1-like isoform X2 [Branchiostoma floridae]